MKTRNQSRRREAFTLIELIVVMGIVGILVTGGLVAFMSTAKNSRLGQARDIVHSTVRTARAYAMSNDRNVLLVFFSEYNGGSVEDARYYRSMAIFDPLMDEDGDPLTAPRGDYVSEWVSIPNGIFMDPSYGLMSNKKDIRHPDQSLTTTTLSNVQMPWIWVTSDGTMQNTVDLRLKIEEGVPTGAAGVYSSTSLANSRFKELIINWVNGSVTTINTSAGDED